MSGEGRLPALNGVRALAAVLVFATHVGQQTGFTSANVLGSVTARLNVGVALFFVLSAFLLYRPWVASRLKGAPGPALPRYALRRAARILPAYWVVLLVLGLTRPDLVPGAFSSDWWVYFGLLQVYDQGTIIQGIGPAWSLATEAAFYIALPALAWLAAKLLSGRPAERQVRLELAALAVTVAAAFALRDLAARQDWMMTFGNTLIGRWPWFAVGLALAVLSAAPSSRRLEPRTAWAGWAAAVAVFAVMVVVLPREVYFMTPGELQWETVLFGAFAVCLVAPVVFGARGRGPGRIAGARLVTSVGTISYGIFLWHFPVINGVVAELPRAGTATIAVVSAAIVVPLAVATWLLVEKPAMRFAARRAASARGPSPALEPAP